MMKIIKKFKIVIISLFLYSGLFVFKSELFFEAVQITKNFLKEMIEVLPPVLVISALISVWVPSEVIRKGLGAESGIKGRILSFAVGSISAGPIYAAFPAVLVLFRKGASISNMVIILSSWAVIKLPMLLVEARFLGLKFTLIRSILTVPSIYLMGLIIERIVNRDEISGEGDMDVLSSLPNLNCGSCGYIDCRAFAGAVESNKKSINDCPILSRGSEKSENFESI